MDAGLCAWIMCERLQIRTLTVSVDIVREKNAGMFLWFIPAFFLLYPLNRYAFFLCFVSGFLSKSPG